MSKISHILPEGKLFPFWWFLETKLEEIKPDKSDIGINEQASNISINEYERHYYERDVSLYRFSMSIVVPQFIYIIESQS